MATRKKRILPFSIKPLWPTKPSYVALNVFDGALQDAFVALHKERSIRTSRSSQQSALAKVGWKTLQ